MPALSDYTAGTITLTNNSTAFTGTGTGWLAAGFREGDTIFQVAGQTQWTGVVATITSNTAGTLVRPWGGATGTYQYRMRYMADGARVTAQARNLIELLGNGNLQAEAAIDGTGGNWLSYFTGAGAKARTAFGTAARSLLGLTAAENKMPYYTDANTAALTDLSAKGRAILAQTNNAGVLTEIGAQPLDSDLTAIAALSTTSFGRALLTMADAGALRSAANAVNKAGDTGVGTLVFGTGSSHSADTVSVGVNRGSPGVGAFVNGGILRSNVNGSAQTNLYAQEQVGTGCHFIFDVYDGNSIRAYFRMSQNGSFSIPGALSKGSGTFLIDHPLDPLNKDLAHGFVEAPRYDLIYRGVVQLSEGRATVDIDAASNMTEGTFDALTINAVVTSLQNQDGFARLRPGAITGGKFEIICEDETCTDTVSWVVIAERNDAFVKSNLDPNTDSDGRFVPERDKPE